MTLQQFHLGGAHDQKSRAGGRSGGGFTRLESDADVKGFLQRHDTVWLTSDQTAALDDYSSSGYVEINEQLRAGKFDADYDIRPTVKELDSAIAASTLKESVTVYRRAHIPGGDSLQPGDSFRDKGYASTAMKVEDTLVFSGKLIAINIRAGKKALPLDAVDDYVSGESEILLPRGSRFRVTGRTTVGNFENVLEVEVA